MLAWTHGQGGPGSPNALAMKPIARFGEGGGRMRETSARSPPGNCARRLRKGMAWKPGGDCSRGPSTALFEQLRGRYGGVGRGLVRRCVNRRKRDGLARASRGYGLRRRDRGQGCDGGQMGSRNTRRRRTCSPLSAGLRPGGWTSSHSNPACAAATPSPGWRVPAARLPASGSPLIARESADARVECRLEIHCGIHCGASMTMSGSS